MSQGPIYYQQTVAGPMVRASAWEPFPVTLSDASSDAFGRIRVSGLETVFDSQLQYDKQPLLWLEDLSGSGTATHVPDESTVDMAVTTADGDSVIRQTREYFRYQPGKSQLILCTCVFGAGQANTTKLVGYGDGSNGLFMGQDGTGMFALLRSSVTGTASDARKVYQTDWNLDKLDGTGPSGITLDPTKVMIIVADIEWLGAGAVRIGVVVSGEIKYVHEFNNANVVATAYMTTANLPVRYEITNGGTAAGAATLKQICAQVGSEGGQQLVRAYPFEQQILSVAMGNGVGNEAPIFGIRHALLFNGIENRGGFKPLSVRIVADGGTIVARMLYNATLTGGSWAAVDSSSHMETNTTATGFSGGIQTNGGIVASGTTGNAAPESGSGTVTSRLPFGLDIDGANPVEAGIVGYALGAGVTGHFSIDWEEIR